MRINDSLYAGPFEPGDKSNLLLYLNDLELFNNTLLIPNPYTEADADHWLDLTAKEFETKGRIANWAIRSDAHGLIGGIGYMERTGWEGHKDEIGYWLGAPFRGKGVMTETVRVFCAYLFENRPQLVRIEANVAPNNAASARVLEKVGFEREGYARKFYIKQGKHRDAVMFALIR